MAFHAPVSGSVAVIGAGPAGLVTARWLLRHGLKPVLFETETQLGGQWNPCAAASATWAGMRTNTSKTLSRFSDREHPSETPLFPKREDMQAYLMAYANQFDLIRRTRFGAHVQQIRRNGTNWTIDWRTASDAGSEDYPAVVIATGAEGAPVIPEITGLAGFSGPLGVLHSAGYKGAERFRGSRVVVVGGSISALEIASDLALGGAGEVVLAARRQRYVLPKIAAGVPMDHILFTREAAEAQANLTPDALREAMRAQIIQLGGDPARYGAPAPDPDVFAAGVTQAQHYLACVAEGRILPRPQVREVRDQSISFADGSAFAADALIFATGYRPALDFFRDAEADALDVRGDGPHLFAHSFHPSFHGLAFIGHYDLIGPKLPVLELQARWVAALWAGKIAPPGAAEVRAGAAQAAVEARLGVQPAMHRLALDFGHRCGVVPDPVRWPALADALMRGPLSPTLFRLEGPDRLGQAPEQFAREAGLQTARSEEAPPLARLEAFA